MKIKKSVSLTEQQATTLKIIGNNNVSKGIEVALKDRNFLGLIIEDIKNTLAMKLDDEISLKLIKKEIQKYEKKYL